MIEQVFVDKIYIKKQTTFINKNRLLSYYQQEILFNLNSKHVSTLPNQNVFLAFIFNFEEIFEQITKKYNLKINDESDLPNYRKYIDTYIEKHTLEIIDCYSPNLKNKFCFLF